MQIWKYYLGGGLLKAISLYAYDYSNPCDWLIPLRLYCIVLILPFPAVRQQGMKYAGKIEKLLFLYIIDCWEIRGKAKEETEWECWQDTMEDGIYTDLLVRK